MGICEIIVGNNFSDNQTNLLNMSDIKMDNDENSIFMFTCTFFILLFLPSNGRRQQLFGKKKRLKWKLKEWITCLVLPVNKRRKYSLYLIVPIIKRWNIVCYI